MMYESGAHTNVHVDNMILGCPWPTFLQNYKMSHVAQSWNEKHLISWPLRSNTYLQSPFHFFENIAGPLNTDDNDVAWAI